MTLKNSSLILIMATVPLMLGACGESQPPTPAAQSEAPTEAAPPPASAQTPEPAPAEPAPDGSLPPLAIEGLGAVESLPARYPEHWFLVHDASFFSMSDGKITVVDVAADNIGDQFKGSFNISMIGPWIEGTRRNEIYALETFYSRGTRGERTDVLTIWDKENLSPIGEVVWPQPKRFSGLPEHHTLTLVDDERFLLALNLDPATSVTVIDLESRAIADEIQIPGCVKMFPTGPRGFSSLCGDGRFLSTQLNDDGTLAKQSRGDAFFDSNSSPIFQRMRAVDGIAYFPTFDGFMIPVDMTGAEAVPGEKWPLVPAAEQAEGWRPGGLGLMDRDDQGRLYILMHPEGGDGSHQSGGAEVWVFDPANRQRLSRIALKEWGLSLAVSRGENPLLLVTNPVSMMLEVYDAGTGEYVRTLDQLFQFTPLLLAGSR